MTNSHPDLSAELAALRAVIEAFVYRPYGQEPYEVILMLEHNARALLIVASLLESQRDEARRKVEQKESRIEELEAKAEELLIRAQIAENALVSKEEALEEWKASHASLKHRLNQLHLEQP